MKDFPPPSSALFRQTKNSFKSRRKTKLRCHILLQVDEFERHLRREIMLTLIFFLHHEKIFWKTLKNLFRPKFQSCRPSRNIKCKNEIRKKQERNLNELRDDTFPGNLLESSCREFCFDDEFLLAFDNASPRETILVFKRNIS